MKLQAMLEVLEEKILNVEELIEKNAIEYSYTEYGYAVGKLSAYREIKSLVNDLIEE